MVDKINLQCEYGRKHKSTGWVCIETPKGKEIYYLFIYLFIYSFNPCAHLCPHFLLENRAEASSTQKNLVSTICLLACLRAKLLSLWVELREQGRSQFVTLITFFDKTAGPAVAARRQTDEHENELEDEFEYLTHVVCTESCICMHA